MAIGLSRSLNLSETNLNLKEAIQKLYAPGIQDDIDLFSLSSQIKSNIVSGPETDNNSQIIGLRSENLKEPDGDVVKRTKFLTKSNTWSIGDKVYFDKYTLTPSTADDAVNPVFSTNGSIPATRILYSGGGYYFKKPSTDGTTTPERFTGSSVVIEDVVLEGDITGSTSARATVTFKPEPGTIFPTSNVLKWKEVNTTTTVNAGDTSTVKGGDNTLQVNADGTWSYVSTNLVQLSTDLVIEVEYVNNAKAIYTIVKKLQSGVNVTGTVDLAPVGTSEQLDHLTKWTGFYTRRFYVDQVVLTNAGSGYLIGERLKIKTETTVTEQSQSLICVIDRQVGDEYFALNPIILSDYYYYEVRSASQGGFYLYNTIVNKFIFLDLEKDEDDFNTIGAREIRIFRNDAIFIENILQLKFAQSRIYIHSYGDDYRIGDTITGEVRALTATADQLRSDSYKSIQNTKNPEEVDSVDNTLGFRYNRILGDDMLVHQRVIMRDQDFILGTSGITGNRLKNEVQMTQFKLYSTSTVTAGSFVTGITYTIATIGSTDFTLIGASANTVGVQFVATGPGTGTGTATTPNTSGASQRIPGLFIKVGAEYKRAFSTKDKPFLTFNDTGAGVVNPAVTGTTYGQYSLFAANRAGGSWFGYDTIISKFAQRLAVPATASDEGKNGALYFHREAAPTVTSVTSGSVTYYEVPLFTYVG